MRRIFLIILILSINVLSFSQICWSFALHGGGAWNLPMPLHIQQEGYPDIHLNAVFKSRSFHPPVYWDWRFTRWNGNRAWEFEAIHHKLYLENTTAEVSDFSISHGYNLLIVNSAWRNNWLDYRLGTGLVLAHPENTIRGKSWGNSADPADMGYVIAGPLINMSISKQGYLYSRAFFNIEARSTFSWARVPVAEGHASLFNWAFQLVAGFGFDFIHTNYPGRKED